MLLASRVQEIIVDFILIMDHVWSCYFCKTVGVSDSIRRRAGQAETPEIALF